MRNKAHVLLFLLVWTGFALAACQPAGTGDSPAGTAGPTIGDTPTYAPVEAPPAGLEGVPWRLISYSDRKGNQASLVPTSEITIEFLDGQVSGSAGCNSYFAAYQLDGERLSFQEAGITERFCTSPEGVMEQEAEYLAALQRAVSYRIADGRLQLLDEQGRTVLLYRR